MKARLFPGTAMLAVASLAALVFVAGASAATVRISITGSVTTGPADPATIDLAAASDLSGANPSGTITLTSPTVFAGATTNVFHGDIVAGGCVRVQGNQAIIVGKLPAGEVFTYTGPPAFGPITHVAALIEDYGVSSGTPVDRASAVWLKSTSATNFCTTKPFSDVTSQVIGLDAGDVSFGYTDQLDAYPGNSDTTVSVVHPNGLSVAITDAPDADPIDKGLQVAVGAGSGGADLDTCGFASSVAAGSTVVVTCASLILKVVTGSAEVVLDDLTTVSIPEGGKAEIADDGSGGFTVANLGSEPITVTVDGVEGTVEPGETSTLEAWDFEGFFAPVDALPMKNVVKAGVAVPLKWRVLDTTRSPVTDLASAAVSVSPLNCTSGEGSDQVEQTTTNGSGLQNLGNGYYQLNWKTQKSYAGTCKTLHLDIGDGVTHDAYFSFTR